MIPCGTMSAVMAAPTRWRAARAQVASVGRAQTRWSCLVFEIVSDEMFTGLLSYRYDVYRIVTVRPRAITLEE
jgi:hypothetical protein